MTSLPIQLPAGFKAVLEEGSSVTAGQTIATKSTIDTVTINIPRFLSISPSKAKKALTKVPGEQVQKNDILALTKNLLGTRRKILRSSVEGTVVAYERATGNLIIKVEQETDEDVIVSPIDGIIGMCNNEKILIETDKNFLTGTKSVGDEAQGKLYILKEDDVFRLDGEAIDKIVLGKRLSREILLKGIGIGVAGMIGAEIEAQDMEHIREKNFNTPIIEVGEENIIKIAQQKDKNVFIDAKANTIIFLAL